jgi:hypothetical protein
MNRWHLHRPPAALRRRSVRLDNIALVPASLLPRKATYQALANALPQGELLIVLPADNTHEQRTLQAVATLWRAKGRRVTTIAADQLDAGTEAR